jgi:opacity protein-like surface antigen
VPAAAAKGLVMSRLKMLFGIGVLVAQATLATAADMPGTLPPPYLPQVPRLRVLDSGLSWYLRGDIGYAWGTVGGAESTPPFPNPTNNTLGNGMTAGVGGGVKSDWIRTDVTLDYLAPLKYQGTVATTNDTSAKVTAFTALFNGYLDLGSWYRITPYVGAGLGAAQIRVFDYSSTASPPFASGTSRAQWKFAWAAMVGVGYVVAPNLMIDLGYRYLNLGDASTASDSFGSMKLKNLAAQELRVGFRWSFDDPRMSR